MKRATFLLALMLVRPAWSQDAMTDAAVNRSRLMVRHSRLPKPDEVRVYDFVNYHRHDLPEPGKKDRVAFDARLLRKDLAKGDVRAVLQLGVSTWRPKPEDVEPVNLAVVIDVSGSMGGGNKLEYVKKGLSILISYLDEDDVLSVVTFGDEARVVRGAAPVSRRKTAIELVNSLKVKGNTNLHSGLMLGYREVERHLDSGRSAKVLLLSDGLANEGVTDREQIVSESRAWNRKGIGLSTIGVGLSEDDALMNALADAARGTYHFLDSAKGIERTFVQEVVGLMGKAGKKPEITLRLADGVHLDHVFGYAFERPEPGTIRFPGLLDLPLRMTQVILVELTVKGDFDPGKGPLAEAGLIYTDVHNGSKEVRSAKVNAFRRAAGKKEGPSDPSVLKNLAIARLGRAFHRACRLAHDESLSEKERFERARDALADTLDGTESLVGPLDQVKDPDVKRLLELVRKARDAMASKR